MADRIRHHAVATERSCDSDDELVVARLGDQGLFINAGIVLRPPLDWSDVVRRMDSVVPPGFTATLLSPFATPDLSDRGWHLVGHPPLMARLGASAPGAMPTDVEIREVADRDDLEVFERTLIDGYPMPDLQPYRWGQFFDERILGGATQMWVGFVDGRPVATSLAHVAAGVNDVEMIATAAGARGRGYGAALTWVATTADPSLPAILIASDLGRPVYERLGYTALTRWTIWLRP